MKRILLTLVLLLLPVVSYAAQEVFSGEITSASPSTFTPAVSTTVTVRIRSTSGSGNVIIEADSWPSGWSVSPKNRNPTINQGTYYDQTFTVTPPSGNSGGTIIWKLYDDDYGIHPSGSKLLATRNQSVSATAPTYTVTFDKQGGSGGSSSVTATYGLPMPSASAPSRTGYTFQGYYTGTGGGGTKYYNSNMSSARNWDRTANTTLYAYWTANTYSVAFDKQGGSGGSSSVTATYGSAMPSASAPSRTGYTFLGYYTGTGGGGTKYYNSNMSSARNWDRTANTTLYAYWTANTYSVAFDKQGGSGGSSSVTATYGSAMPSASAPSRTGYTFEGYYTGTGGGGTKYYNSNMSSARNWDRTANTTLYAYWTGWPDLIAYSVSVSDTTVDPGQSITVNWTAKNQGTASAGATQQGVMWSSDSTITRSDTLLDREYLGSMGIGVTSPESHSVTIPTGATPGQTYYIGVYADYDLAINEGGNEGNNGSSAVAVTVNAPDLRVTSMKMAGSTASDQHFNPGQAISLDFQGYNGGNGKSKTSVQMKWYYGTSANAKTTYIDVGYLGIINGLAVGEYEWETDASWSVPTTPGTYWLTVVIDSDGNNTESNESNNEATMRFYVDTPDLIAYSVSASDTTVDPGQSITVNWTAKNQGTASAGATQQGVMWSSDSTITRSDTLLDREYLGSMGIGVTSPESHSVTIPTGATPGQTYYIGVYADYDLAINEGGNEGNNGSSAVAVTVNAPDLRVTSMKMAGSTASDQHFDPGQAISLDFQGYNGGNGKSKTSVQMKWYYGTSANAKTTYIDVGYLGIINGLAVGEYEWETDASWSVPTTPGTYWLTVVIDSDGNNTESNESNNEATMRFYVDTPDLIVTQVTDTASSYTIGDKINATATIKNNGQAQAGSSKIYYYLGSTSGSTSSGPTTIYKSIEEGSISSLPAGSSENDMIGNWITGGWTIPPDVAAGSYCIWVKADSSNQIDEGSAGEDNNWGSSVSFTISAPKADLIVTQVTDTASSYTIGDKINATATIKNNGQAQAGSSKIYYYLGSTSGSTSSGPTTIYKSIEEGSISSLPAGSSENDMIGNWITGGWTIPPDVAAGTYRIWVKADSSNQIDEGSAGEDNNWGSSVSFTISAPKADLIVTQVTDTASSYTIGDKINATATIKNNGQAQAGSSKIYYYLGSTSGSTSSGPTTIYKSIEEGSISSLPAGSSENDMIGNWITGGWTIPPDVAAGSYCIWVKADSSNQIDEGSAGEDNNWGSSDSFTIVEPDLRGAVNPSDKDYYPGDTAVFEFVVLNDGQASANAGEVYYYVHKSSVSFSPADMLEDQSDSYEALGIGETSSQRFWWHIPKDTVPGIYYVSFWVDATNTTTHETDEENNKGSLIFEVKERIGPDRRLDIIYPGSPDRDNISWFIHVTDTHIGNELSEVDNLVWLRDVAYPTIAPDFIVNSGDLTESFGIWEDWMHEGPFPPGDPCCNVQDEEEWNEYFNIVKMPGFRDNYYDTPGNHDRYGDPEWNGMTGNDGYLNLSISEQFHRGISESPVGQFIWERYSNFFMTINTCDEEGTDMDVYSLLTTLASDLPKLSENELDDLEAKLFNASINPNGKLKFVFAHHSIISSPDYSGLPGLYDARIDNENLNSRGAENLITLLNDYQVSAYGFGHTHDAHVFVQESLESVPNISAVRINTGALAIGEYRIEAIDNGGVSTVSATVNSWPIVLITSPVNMQLAGNNPYSYPLPKTCSNSKVRALVFSPNSESLTVQYRANSGEWRGMTNIGDHIWEGDLDLSGFSSGQIYSLSVQANNGNNVSDDEVWFEVKDPITTVTLDPVSPGKNCTIDVTGFSEGAYFRLAWDGKTMLATEQFLSGSTSYTFMVPDDAEIGSHYIRAFDEDGNYIVYYLPVVGADLISPDTTITSGPSGEIDYNNVTFTYTGSDDITETPNLVYSYKLEGYDSDWSGYSSSTLKDYWNLPNGSYTFYARAKDEAGNVDNSPDSQAFTVKIVGIVSVNVTPDTASWTISGPTGFEGNEQTITGDRTFTNAPVGSYSWSGGNLSGYYTPPPEIKTLTNGGTITFDETWTQTPPPTGSLLVSITPQGAIEAGAQWRVDGGTWRDSGDTQSGLSVGQHTVEFLSISGWNKPSNQNVTISSEQTTSTTGTYTAQTGSLCVTISPQGAIDAGAQWRRVGTSTWRNSGYTESSILVGTYTVEFKVIPGWRPPSNQHALVQVGSITSCLGNYVEEVASPPTVTTSNINQISRIRAEGGGNVTWDGGSDVTSRGVCWGTIENPTIYDNITTDGVGTGNFNSVLNGLSPGTHYFVRAYATNSQGTSYGSNVEFATRSVGALPWLNLLLDQDPVSYQIVFISDADGQNDLWVMDVLPNGDTANAKNLTQGDYGNVMRPDWSPDGKEIIFVSDLPGNYQLYTIKPDGSGATRLTHDTKWYRSPRYSPDGNQILASTSDSQPNTCAAYSTMHLRVLDTSGNLLQEFFNTNGHGHYDGIWSSDGTQIYYSRDENTCSNPYDIWTMKTDGTGRTAVYPTNGDWNYQTLPLPSSDGIILFSERLYTGSTWGDYYMAKVMSDGSDYAVLNAEPRMATDWAFDEAKILYYRANNGKAELFFCDADGTGETRLYQPDGSNHSARFIKIPK